MAISPDDRTELENLRKLKRLAELEAKAGGETSTTQTAQQTQTYGEPVASGEQFQVGNAKETQEGLYPKPDGMSLLGTLATGYPAQRDALLNNITSAGASTYGNIVGGTQQILEPLLARIQGRPQRPLVGSQTRDYITEQLTYQPRTAEGQAIVEGQGELLAPVGEAIEYTRMGDEALDAGLPEWAARMAEATPEYAGALLAMFGIKANPKGAIRSKKAAPIQSRDVNPAPGMKPVNIRIEPTLDIVGADPAKVGGVLGGTKEAAKLKFNATGQLVKNPAGIKATSAGWGDNVIGHVSSLTQSEKGLYKQMVASAKKYYSEYAAKGRPSDVVGMEFSKNVQYLKQQKMKSGKLLDVIAKDLAGKKVNVSEFVTKLRQDIFELGGKIDDNGKVVFGRDSQLYNITGDQRALIGLYEKSKGLANPSALQVHEAKKWLDNYINYGKSITSAENSITKKIQPLLQGYRASLNETVRKVSPAYAKQNDIFSTSAGSLADLQSAMGTTDILSPMAPQFLGQKFRAFLGNNQNRLKIEMAVGEAQAAAKQLGGKFPEHDITAQMRFINDMEKMWGPFTETSFKAEIGQAASRQMQAPSITQTGLEAARLTQRQLNKLKVSRDAQIKAMDGLLNQ